MLSADLAWIYGAALKAAASEDSAADAAREALRERPTGESRQALMARAVAHALRRAPVDPLAALAPHEREAIGLARIVGMSVDEIAAFSGRASSEVKASMRSGLERLAGRLAAAGAV